MAGLGWTELLIVLAIVLLIFGVGRVSKLGEELGKGIRAFREGVQSEDKEEPAEEQKDEAAE